MDEPDIKTLSKSVPKNLYGNIVIINDGQKGTCFTITEIKNILLFLLAIVVLSILCNKW
jgi:hypothetical protein